MHTLVALPVELLYDVQLLATSHALPRTCKALYNVFASSPASYRARYLAARTDSSRARKHPDVVLTQMLRYPLCTQDVLEAYFRQRLGSDVRSATPRLPRRLFRALVRKTTGWSDRDAPLPLLRYLYGCRHLGPPDADAHDGYALTKAVQVGFVPLVRFLLDHGATPARKEHLSIMIAIRRKDLGLVRMLVEGTQGIEVTSRMLRAAVVCRAQDIVEYLVEERGCIPDMETLLLMR